MAFVPALPVIGAFTLAAAILIVTPGPDMTLFLGRALTQGRLAGIAALLGASTGLFVHTMLAAFGLSALLATSPAAFFTVKAAGALYLVFLAVQAIRKGSALTLERRAAPGRSFLENWATGLGINLLNPKIVLFFVTFLPQFVSVQDPDAGAKLAFLGLYFIALELPACTAMILAADRFSSALRSSPRIARAIDYVFAGVFGAFALRIVLTRAQ
ncbi:LysE family translocator [Propylenella binzhouense]|uniref:LysE family translocator n=1 Tax=Propylenella binzhouense TaxID=2555902 RepID=A0A964T5R9_9HYPH|nr:LysE family translocator [Propylenella binzhouense]MYZ49036.1 LysE family translocator [Propylenella binzhouense]